MLTRPALLVPSGDEVLEQATMAASEVTQQMLMQKMELEEKKRSVAMLQKALVRIVKTVLFGFKLFVYIEFQDK
jgi:hypothetical protein